jgi:eukaryotic-like serine/threonine-protein kinase
MPNVGRYEILDKLGEGAMGVVSRARDRTIGRVVALKMLSAELHGEAELHQRFRREVEAIGRLSHPNIVTVYDFGETDGHLYMAMELLEGKDLRTLIEEQADIALPERLRILTEIGMGLGYAHEKGVVHRDIKPANIVVTSSGQVKILDFGLARLGSAGAITRRGVILGTPDYMSPEQATGKTVDHRSDIFSAGSVFYEFLTLEKPFRGKTLHSVLYQILSHEPTPMLTLNPDLPARLAAAVHRMLHKQPERRQESMNRVVADLEGLAAVLRRTGVRPGLVRRRRAAVAVSLSSEVRGQIAEHVRKGRAHFDANEFREALREMQDALKLDPACEDAAEVLWRSQQRLHRESDLGSEIKTR